MKTVLLIALSLCSLTAFSQSFLQVKKSFNPKNVLHVSAEVEECKLVEPYVTSYWIMGEAKNKVAKLNVFEKPQFSPEIIAVEGDVVKFTAKALQNANINPVYKILNLRLINCQPHVFVDFNGRELELKEIFADAKLFYKGKPVFINYVIIDGQYSDGEKFNKKVDIH